jgi:hypothetical protein
VSGSLYARDISYYGGPQRLCFFLNMRGWTNRQIISFGPNDDAPGCPFFAMVTKPPD